MEREVLCYQILNSGVIKIMLVNHNPDSSLILTPQWWSGNETSHYLNSGCYRKLPTAQDIVLADK